jgi:hypothetical protein
VYRLKNGRASLSTGCPGREGLIRHASHSQRFYSISYDMIRQSMAKILIRVDEDVARKVRRIVKEKHGGKRGALSIWS